MVIKKGSQQCQWRGGEGKEVKRCTSMFDVHVPPPADGTVHTYKFTTFYLYYCTTFSFLNPSPTLLDGANVRLNWNIESDLNVNLIKFKNFLSLY
jgi:hypothetical protein